MATAVLTSFACGMCGKCFKMAAECVEHIQIHTSYRPFRCLVCWPLFTDMADTNPATVQVAALETQAVHPESLDGSLTQSAVGQSGDGDVIPHGTRTPGSMLAIHTDSDDPNLSGNLEMESLQGVPSVADPASDTLEETSSPEPISQKRHILRSADQPEEPSADPACVEECKKTADSRSSPDQSPRGRRGGVCSRSPSKHGADIPVADTSTAASTKSGKRVGHARKGQRKTVQKKRGRPSHFSSLSLEHQSVADSRDSSVGDHRQGEQLDSDGAVTHPQPAILSEGQTVHGTGKQEENVVIQQLSLASNKESKCQYTVSSRDYDVDGCANQSQGADILSEACAVDSAVEPTPVVPLHYQTSAVVAVPEVPDADGSEVHFDGTVGHLHPLESTGSRSNDGWVSQVQQPAASENCDANSAADLHEEFSSGCEAVEASDPGGLGEPSAPKTDSSGLVIQVETKSIGPNFSSVIQLLKSATREPGTWAATDTQDGAHQVGADAEEGEPQAVRESWVVRKVGGQGSKDTKIVFQRSREPALQAVAGKGPPNAGTASGLSWPASAAGRTGQTAGRAPSPSRPAQMMASASGGVCSGSNARQAAPSATASPSESTPITLDATGITRPPTPTPVEPGPRGTNTASPASPLVELVRVPAFALSPRQDRTVDHPVVRGETPAASPLTGRSKGSKLSAIVTAADGSLHGGSGGVDSLPALTDCAAVVLLDSGVVSELSDRGGRAQVIAVAAPDGQRGGQAQTSGAVPDGAETVHEPSLSLEDLANVCAWIERLNTEQAAQGQQTERVEGSTSTSTSASTSTSSLNSQRSSALLAVGDHDYSLLAHGAEEASRSLRSGALTQPSSTHSESDPEKEHMLSCLDLCRKKKTAAKKSTPTTALARTRLQVKMSQVDAKETTPRTVQQERKKKMQVTSPERVSSSLASDSAQGAVANLVVLSTDSLERNLSSSGYTFGKIGGTPVRKTLSVVLSDIGKVVATKQQATVYSEVTLTATGLIQPQASSSVAVIQASAPSVTVSPTPIHATGKTQSPARRPDTGDKRRRELDPNGTQSCEPTATIEQDETHSSEPTATIEQDETHSSEPTATVEQDETHTLAETVAADKHDEYDTDTDVEPFMDDAVVADDTTVPSVGMTDFVAVDTLSSTAGAPRTDTHTVGKESDTRAEVKKSKTGHKVRDKPASSPSSVRQMSRGRVLTRGRLFGGSPIKRRRLSRSGGLGSLGDAQYIAKGKLRPSTLFSHPQYYRRQNIFRSERSPSQNDSATAVGTTAEVHSLAPENIQQAHAVSSPQRPSSSPGVGNSIMPVSPNRPPSALDAGLVSEAKKNATVTRTPPSGNKLSIRLPFLDRRFSGTRCQSRSAGYTGKLADKKDGQRMQRSLTPFTVSSENRPSLRHRSATKTSPEQFKTGERPEEARRPGEGVLSEISQANDSVSKTGAGSVNSVCDKGYLLKKGGSPVEPTADSNTTVTRDDQVHECTECGARFSHEMTLMSHMAIHEAGLKSHTCDICFRTFSRPYSVKIHRMIHTREASVDCDVCGRTLANPGNLAIHMRIHTDERPFKCDFCGKGFRQHAALNSHLRTHNKERPFECEYCGKRYAFQKNLYTHRFVHTGQRPYQCKTCGASYRQMSALKVHYRAHTGEKPFKCPHCSSAFAQKSHLKKHLRHLHQPRISEDEKLAKDRLKAHRCRYCNKGFSSLFSVRRHITGGYCTEHPGFAAKKKPGV